MGSEMCIRDRLDEKEKEAQIQFLNFIESQKETAQSLKNSLLSIKDITSPDAAEEIIKIKEQISLISEQQEIRKDAVMKTFTDFQQLHHRMIECLESLLSKGENILIKDIKKINKQIFI